MQKYILDGHTPVPTNDLMEWARFFENSDARRVAETHVGDVRVSTVFLGLDHRFTNGEPLIFETMIFGGEHDGYCERCSTWKGAEYEHRKALALLQPVDAVAGTQG
jgi:hypothetical protein